MANDRNRTRSPRRGQTRDYGTANDQVPYEYWEYEYYDVPENQTNQGMNSSNQPAWTYAEYWWAIPGPHTGKGPKGYERSDQDIQDEVNQRLTQHGQLDASNIEVQVNDCEVTLTGTVNHRQDKRLAEDIADSVMGVQDVHNRLHVNKQGAQQQNRRMEAGQTQSKNMPSNMKPGEKVVASSGKQVGTVRQVGAHDFVLKRVGITDLLIPFDAVQDTQGGQVQLNVPADQIDSQGWERL